MLTIKELTAATGGDITPRMVRHYHQIGLLPQPQRSPSNYRLYTDADVKRLQRIVALKQQGFQLSHIKQVLDSAPAMTETFLEPLRQHYQRVQGQLVRLRQTATALEGILGRDQACLTVQASALAQLRLLDAETQAAQDLTDDLWQHLDAAVPDHPENVQESLRQLLPNLSNRPEIEADLLAHLVLACGDVSLAAFVRLSQDAIKAARESLQRGCTIVADVPAVAAALDQARLQHLGCPWTVLCNDPHLDGVGDTEQAFWSTITASEGRGNPAGDRFSALMDGNIWVVGYAPSVLLKLCEQIETTGRCPALVIGMPLGFSHAPAAKRRLMSLNIPFVTVAGSLGGGQLAAVALNRLAASLIEKPDCHCYLSAVPGNTSP